MAATIDELHIEIQASSSDVSKGIGALVASLNKLKKAVDIKGVASLNKNLKDLQEATSQLSVGTGNKISSLAKGLRELSEVPKAQISAALAKQIVSIGTAVRLIKDIDFAPLNQLATGLSLISSVKKPEVTLTTAQHIEALGNSVRSLKDADFGLVTELANALRSFENIKKSNLGETLNQLKKVPEIINSISSANINAFSVGITQLVDALSPLSEIEKSNLGSVLNQLKKIPEITKALSSRELAKFGLQIRLVTKYIQPLATEMEKVSRGFSALPARVQKVINANARLSKSNTKTAFSFNMMAMRIGILFTAARRLAYVVSAWINESSAYVENLNLFAVSMGNAADAAKNYAETVGELLGIDPSDWMRNQGVFMTLLTGFGVVEDKAALMSKQLTQLGYDISSYFNISVFEAMQKLQSGIAGELEPLRRIGYDLSQAKLQATALALGIEKNVSAMTQAEKAYLRYYAILTQVTTVQGDMARTLESPNNQMRILQAQLVQLCRALGNVFIPLLNKILPYAIAFVRVLRDIANTIGVIVGFELPEFDYSGVGQIGNDADEAADAFDELDKNAKKLTKTLLKFDELNVINSGDLTDAVEDIKDIVNINLPTYDFLSELSENKVSEIVQAMKEWLGLTENISTWSELMDTRFGSILKAAMGIAGFLAAWKISSSIVNIVSGLNSALPNLHTQAGKVTTALIGAGGLLYGLNSAAEGGKELAGVMYGNSEASLSNALMNLVGGVGLGAVGGAMIGGPIGAVIGGLAGMAAGIAGLLFEEQKYIRETVLADNFSEQGVAVSDLAQKLDDMFQPYNDYIEKQKNLNAQLETAKTRFDDAKVKVDVLLRRLESRPALESSDIDELSNAFNELFESFKQVSNLQFDTILEGLYQAIKVNLGEKAQKEISGLITQLQSLKRELGMAVAADQARVQEILSSVPAGGKLTAAQTAELTQIYTRLAQTAVTESPEVESLEKELYKLQQKGFSGDFGELMADLQRIQKQYEDVVAGLNWSAKKQKDALDNAKRSLAAYGIDASGLQWSDIAKYYDAAAQQMVNNVSQQYTQVIQAISQKVSTMKSEDFDQFYDAYKNSLENIILSAGGLWDAILPKESHWRSDSRAKQYADKMVEETYGQIQNLLDELIKQIENNIKSIYLSNSSSKSYAKDRLNLLNGGFRLYGSGGFPERGEVFIANESGPEMVGTIGRRTAVANNDQIVEGISDGVYAAVVAALRDSNYGDSAPFVIELDSDPIYKGVVNRARREFARTGQTGLVY